MRAVWSFWSKPFYSHRSGVWASELHHLLAWTLSFETARRHYRRTALHTDAPGKELLVDRLGLAFDEVHPTLDVLSERDPGWWALGKLYAYEAQSEPFLHIDSDVFLFRSLPARLASAPVVAQNPESFVPGASFYQPESFEEALGGSADAWLPAEWSWFRSSGAPQRGDCCGVFGGAHVAFIRHYAEQAIRLMEHTANQPGLASLDDKVGHNVEFEQYLLAACIEYHRAHADSPFGKVSVDYVFPSQDAAFDPENASRLGYTHLIAGAKRDPEIARRLELRVRRDYPDAYRRCLDCAGETRRAS